MFPHREIPAGAPEDIMPATATYTTEGHLTVDVDGSYSDLGYFDADGAEWVAGVDAMLAEAGYLRTGDWDGDVAPVQAR
jgi:hypothetical protein